MYLRKPMHIAYKHRGWYVTDHIASISGKFTSM